MGPAPAVTESTLGPSSSASDTTITPSPMACLRPDSQIPWTPLEFEALHALTQMSRAVPTPPRLRTRAENPIYIPILEGDTWESVQRRERICPKATCLERVIYAEIGQAMKSMRAQQTTNAHGHTHAHANDQAEAWPTSGESATSSQTLQDEVVSRGAERGEGTGGPMRRRNLRRRSPH
ncbi:hypothetical protein EV356DRAFT_511090 [Viridothelium virens]|uniref:Uncharacterized protein n=1 Tax=Viridothelium virens TaxID=1048519 RepID=A0A6A6GVC0_VIRVR|nr:hypothetical protein EV356DRAFT_511090 [Viridothelium virens]